MKTKSLFLILIFIISFYRCSTATKTSPRFNHVMLYTSNLESTVNFYTTAFDLEVTNTIKKLKRTKQDGSISESEVNIALLKFLNQGFVLEIAEISNLTESVTSGYNVYQHLGVNVINIETALERIIKAGAEVIAPLELAEMNGLSTQHVFLKGPNGETIELMQVMSGSF